MAKIPENVLNVLGECRADGNLLYLPSVQLDRKTYTEVNKVLENMGGKWNRKAKAHVFAEDDDVAEMLENVLLTQEVKDLKREYQFFPTPRAVAKRCARWLSSTAPLRCWSHPAVTANWRTSFWNITPQAFAASS